MVLMAFARRCDLAGSRLEVARVFVAEWMRMRHETTPAKHEKRPTTIEDVPVPTPRAGQALVKVAASLVSAGTERMVVEFAEKSLLGKARSRPDLVKQVSTKCSAKGILPHPASRLQPPRQPMALGYSSAGTIIALGAGMDGFKVGQRVACAGGGYAVHAEYNIVPRNLLTPCPTRRF
jgi:threonine dehydrogenase-like Zn-dependent dehydrogenase